MVGGLVPDDFRRDFFFSSLLLKRGITNSKQRTRPCCTEVEHAHCAQNNSVKFVDKGIRCSSCDMFLLAD